MANFKGNREKKSYHNVMILELTLKSIMLKFSSIIYYAGIILKIVSIMWTTLVAANQVHSAFISYSRFDWFFPRDPMFVMRISYLIGAKLQQSSLFTNAYHSYFIKAIEHLFYEFTGVINPPGMLGEQRCSVA